MKYVDEVLSNEEWMPKVVNSEIPVVLDCYAE